MSPKYRATSEVTWFFLIGDSLVVGLGFSPQNFVKWQGPTNGTLSIYECRFTVRDTMGWGGAHKLYIMQNNLLDLHSQTARDAKFAGDN